MGLALEIIGATTGRAAGRTITRVIVEVGKLAMVVPEALEFAFEVAAQGTGAEGARLDIVELSARARCRGCGRELEIEAPWDSCPCGGLALEWLSGEEMRIKAMEVI